MRKLRTWLVTVAVIVAVGSAIAETRSTKTPTLYYLNFNGGYDLAGIDGYDYVCEFGPYTPCTYTFNEATQTYKPYKNGKFSLLR